MANKLKKKTELNRLKEIKLKQEEKNRKRFDKKRIQEHEIIEKERLNLSKIEKIKSGEKQKIVKDTPLEKEFEKLKKLQTKEKVFHFFHKLKLVKTKEQIKEAKKLKLKKQAEIKKSNEIKIKLKELEIKRKEKNEKKIEEQKLAENERLNKLKLDEAKRKEKLAELADKHRLDEINQKQKEEERNKREIERKRILEEKKAENESLKIENINPAKKHSIVEGISLENEFEKLSKFKTKDIELISNISEKPEEVAKAEDEIERAIKSIRKQTVKRSIFKSLFKAKEKKTMLKEIEDMPAVPNPIIHVRHDKNENVINMVHKAREALMQFDLDTAKSIYIEIIREYNSLPSEEKEKVYVNIKELYEERKNAESLNIH